MTKPRGISARAFMDTFSTAGRISGADSKIGGAVVPEQGDCAAAVESDESYEASEALLNARRRERL